MQRPIVLVSGGFDPLHSGHIAMFKEAAEKGDLTVALNSDDWLERKKGKSFMSFKERTAVIRELKCVQSVIRFDDSDGTAKQAILDTMDGYPHRDIIFANGGDRTDQNIPELDLCNQYDIDVVFGIGGKNKMQSSSSLLSEWNANFTERKWGRFNSLHNSKNVRVKQLVIEPFKSISLQFHYNREEHWFIEDGTALVERGCEQIELHPGDVIKIDKMQLHRVTNISVPKKPLKLIEVQIGDILDEQDIVRVEETRS